MNALVHVGHGLRLHEGTRAPLLLEDAAYPSSQMGDDY